MRLIDADKLEKLYKGWLPQLILPEDEKDKQAIETCIAVLEDAPTIDPESLRPQGHWIGEADGYADGELVYDVWYCSECNHCIDDGTDDPDLLPKFCSECGAKMSVVTDCAEEVENLE